MLHAYTYKFTLLYTISRRISSNDMVLKMVDEAGQELHIETKEIIQHDLSLYAQLLRTLKCISNLFYIK